MLSAVTLQMDYFNQVTVMDSDWQISIKGNTMLQVSVKAVGSQDWDVTSYHTADP